MTRIIESTPERFSLERCRLAQSSGEWPGVSCTLPRAFGVLTVGPAEGMPKPALFEPGGPRLGTGPRFGRGPVVGILIEWLAVGRARRLEGATRGGGMREVAGLAGGAMRFGLVGGGGMEIEGTGTGTGPEARCAELMAGNEGGGRLSSSSSSELSCSFRVKVGTAGASFSGRGAALGVVCGDSLSAGDAVSVG